jgi:hypothetical protein
MIEQDAILRRINAYIQELRLGECACVAEDTNGRTLAYLYLAPGFRDSALVASWFHDFGAVAVDIDHTIYSDADDARDGLMHGCQAWTVSFQFQLIG